MRRPQPLTSFRKRAFRTAGMQIKRAFVIFSVALFCNCSFLRLSSEREKELKEAKEHPFRRSHGERIYDSPEHPWLNFKESLEVLSGLREYHPQSYVPYDLEHFADEAILAYRGNWDKPKKKIKKKV